MPEQGTSHSSDHDLLMQIKALQEASNKELATAQSQVNKDIYNLSMIVKELRTEHREDFCKLDKRIGAIEKKDAVYEACFEAMKEGNIVKKDDLKELAIKREKQFAEVYEAMKKEDEETRDELRRALTSIGVIAGIIGAVGGSVMTIIVMLYLG
jgi:ribosomal protein L20